MTDIRQVLAQNMKALRKLRGFSQEILAEKAGTSTTHIGNIEICKHFPSTDLLMKIAAALGVDTPELFSVGKLEILPMTNVSLQKLYSDILEDFGKIVSSRIDDLKEN